MTTPTPVRRRPVPRPGRGGAAGLSVLALLLALLASVAPAIGADAPLPTDPALVSGRLPNGLQYIVRRHPTAEQRTGVWLHVATGSLNETESTRGIAHFLEHMAFDGSKNFPPGSVVPFFESLGLSFGRDQNAFTSFDQTTYQLVVPSADTQAMDKALLFLSDVAMRLSLLPEQVDRERQIILEEKRTRSSADQRVEDFVLERLAPESTFGRRLPIGTEATIRAATAQDLRDYYTRWYVPANMTVIVVGDCDPAAVVAGITRHFAEGPATPAPAPQAVDARPTAARRAIAASDPDLTRAAVSLARVEPPNPPTTTVARYRRELVERVGRWTFDRRLDAAAARGQVAFDDAGVSLEQWRHALRVGSVEVTGRPEVWPAMLTDLGAHLQRTRLYGFTAREIEDARVALLAEAREAVQREPTEPVRSVLRDINSAVTEGEPVMSASQELGLLQRLLPGITPREVSAAFATHFDPARVMVITQLPAGPDVPTEPALLALGNVALDVRPARVAEVPRPTALLPTLPRPGLVVESTADRPTSVESLWLDNGVRVHYRRMDQRKNKVIVTVTLAGGVIQETAANRGVTDAATQAWRRPATGRLTSIDVRDLMNGAQVSLAVSVGEDTVRLGVSGDRSGMERGLQLAYLLLTDPSLEPVALRQWQEDQSEAIRARDNDPASALGAVTASALFPLGEVRTRPLALEQVRAVTRDAAQAWLRRLVATAPIEVAVVGDIGRAEAVRLVAQYLGALPARPRIGDKTLHDLRTIARPAGPISVTHAVQTQTPQAIVLQGFFAADARDVRDVRLLTLASRLLSTRMFRDLREDQRLVYDIEAISEPAEAYPGFGVFAAQAPTDPARVRTLAASVDTMFARFAQDGPSESEMTVAQKQILNRLDEELARPEFWVSRLATLDYRGRSLTELAAAKTDYAAFTAAEVRDTFRRYHRREASFTILVVPEGSVTAERGAARDRS